MPPIERLSEGSEPPATGSAGSATVGKEPAALMPPGPPPPPAMPEDLQAAVLSSLPSSFVSDPVPEPSCAAAAIVSESRASYDASEILIQFEPVGPEATPQAPAAAHAHVAQLASPSTPPARAASALPGGSLEPDAVSRAGWRTPTLTRTLTRTLTVT